MFEVALSVTVKLPPHSKKSHAKGGEIVQSMPWDRVWFWIISVVGMLTVQLPDTGLGVKQIDRVEAKLFGVLCVAGLAKLAAWCPAAGVANPLETMPTPRRTAAIESTSIL